MYIYETGLITEIDTIDFWVVKLWEDLWGEKLEKDWERKGKRESDVILFKLKMYKIWKYLIQNFSVSHFKLY